MYIYLYRCVYFFTLLRTGKKTHRGALLAEAIKETGVNISKLVKRMGIARGTYYNHKNDPDLSLEQLAEYGKQIKYDFSEEIPELKKYAFEDPEVPYHTPKTIEEAVEQRDYWRERYYKKVEEMNKLMMDMKK